MEAFKPFAGLLIRHLLTVIAGILVGKGLLQAAQLDTFVGSGVLLGTVMWSAWEKLAQPSVLGFLVNRLVVKNPEMAAALIRNIPAAPAAAPTPQ